MLTLDNYKRAISAVRRYHLTIPVGMATLAQIPRPLPDPEGGHSFTYEDVVWTAFEEELTPEEAMCALLPITLVWDVVGA